jgi:XTP/dITP diphosphohydrolase
MTGHKLLLATTNRGKLAELRRMLEDASVSGAIEGAAYAVHPLDDLPALGLPAAPEVIEDGETFQANAEKKAVTLAAHARLWTLADDSGLEVDALGGQPGVRSARFAGEGASDGDNNDKLLAALAGVPDARRTARFRCVLALADPQGHVRHTAHGTCEGRILRAPRGQHGFGYDPLFAPLGGAHSLAELTPDRKHAISHRGQAMRAMVAYLLAQNGA